MPMVARSGVNFTVPVAVTVTCATARLAHAMPQMPKVRYEVNGPAVAEFIYYQTDDGQLHQVNAPLPWSTEFTGFGGQVFSISAQGPAPISCKILLDGNVVSAATATTGAPARTVCTH